MNCCELCDEPIYPHGFYVCLRVRGTWRWLRVCETCYAVYLQMEDDD